ncbi:MAG: response regulator [Thermoanaerobaculia bacterium]|nr:response regulator [Thermoanaerobaculia bacterium]
MARRSAVPSGHRSDGDGRRLRILVADDDDVTRRSLKRLLESYGHRASTAVDGAQALELLGRRRFDLAILDLAMPRLDGLEVARRVRRGETMNEPSLVAFTARTRPSDRQATREAGFGVHLGKPLDVGRLRRLLDQLATA